MTVDIAKLTKSLRDQCPSLSDEQLATSVAVAQIPASRVDVPETRPSIPTVTEFMKTVRKTYMEIEAGRVHAKVQPDGSVKAKDTTTYRTYNTHWKRLVEAYGDR